MPLGVRAFSYSLFIQIKSIKNYTQCLFEKKACFSKQSSSFLFLHRLLVAKNEAVIRKKMIWWQQMRMQILEEAMVAIGLKPLGLQVSSDPELNIPLAVTKTKTQWVETLTALHGKGLHSICPFITWETTPKETQEHPLPLFFPIMFSATSTHQSVTAPAPCLCA